MENVYIDLGDDLTIGDGSSMVIGEDNLLAESESIVGPQGPPGPPGPAGFSPIATVTQNAGSATITITDATTTSSATVYDGTDGVDGSAATITVGSTTTGEPGTQASVTNSGTSSAAILDFIIPKGVKGDQGEQGDAATVDVGTIVAIAPDDTPQVTNSGTVHDAILNFAIPQGYDGFSPVATVTQNTGSATITITDENGTTTATVYDGATGATGPQGPAGPTGPMGPGRLVYLGKIDAMWGINGANRSWITANPEYQNTTYCQYYSDGTIHINKAGTYMLWASARIVDNTTPCNIAYNFTFDATGGDKGNWIVKNDIMRLTCNATMFKTLTTSDSVTMAVYVDGATLDFYAGDIALMYVGDNN